MVLQPCARFERQRTLRQYFRFRCDCSRHHLLTTRACIVSDNFSFCGARLPFWNQNGVRHGNFPCLTATRQQLQRGQEGDQLLLFFGSQLVEAIGSLSCLALVTLDCIFQRERLEIMHIAGFRSESPERAGTQFVRGVRRAALDDAVAGPHVMQQEIAERMNDFVSQSLWVSESPAIHHRSGRRCSNGFNVAEGALNSREEVPTLLGIGGFRQNSVTRWDLSATNELSKMVDVR